MKKLLKLFDAQILKFGVGFLIAFTALYPKLPSIHIAHTWVYVRLEDFSIALVVAIWAVQVVRRKASLPFPEAWAIFSYWIVGFFSLFVTVLFIGSHLANFFPSIAVLEYLRRIEYMILFFVAFSTVKTIKDIKFYLYTLFITLSGVVLYGFGQRFYIYLWKLSPDFFRKYPICFPAFLTGNEEFAKGTAFCLSETSRIASTFGGHYDLAAYLVFLIPVIVLVFFAVKRWYQKFFLCALSIGAILLLILTSSRTSFAAYLIGVIAALFFVKKKKLIIPVVFVSILLLFVFSGSTVNRFMQTVRLTSVVTNKQGQVVGVAESTLPQDLKNKISKDPTVVENQPSAALPAGTLTSPLISLHSPTATNVAVVKTSLSLDQIKKLKLQNGGVSISTVSGSFLIQKALVYDISFTTRFQGEWPRDWTAFLKYPWLGQGYSTVTLASDNDYLRALAETGVLGLLSFLFIFVIFGILVAEVGSDIPSTYNRSFIMGIAGGLVGLFMNATLIDVFEASKVAEGLWLLLGISVGMMYLYKKAPVSYWNRIRAIIFAPLSIAIYFLIVAFLLYSSSFVNFFVGNDFTWLRWAASSTGSSVKDYFLHADGFLYRPIAKLIMFFLYTSFSFYPQGYHIFILLLHFLMAFGVYLLANLIFKKRYLGFLAGLLFLVLPGRAESFFWISSMSAVVSAVFVLYSFILFIRYRCHESVVSYIFSVLFALLGFFSFEAALVLPLFLVGYDLLLVKRSHLKKEWRTYTPYLMGVVLYVIARVGSHALGFGGSYLSTFLYSIPNFFINLLGYIMLFIFGNSYLSWYSVFQNGSHVLSIFIVSGILLVIFFAVFQFFHKKLLLQFSTSDRFRVIVFFLLFILIALLPFVGLGTITQGYGYLASVGFVLLVVYGLYCLIGAFGKGLSEILIYTIVSILLLVFGYFSYFQLIGENADWNKAGSITNNALLYIKVYDDNVLPGSSFYFVNTPEVYQTAWVFPEGLEDAVWFVYRDPTLQVQQRASVADATIESSNAKKTSYIFIFDKNGTIHEADHHDE